jgi:hypothetical protein
MATKKPAYKLSAEDRARKAAYEKRAKEKADELALQAKLQKSGKSSLNMTMKEAFGNRK